MLRYLALVVLAVAPQVLAQSGAYGQCGGSQWSGATTCVSGYTCTYSNPYYSQCTPGSASSSSSSASSSSKTSSSSSSSSTGTKTTTTITTTASSTSTAPSSTGTGYQIRAVEDPVFHFYLQDNAGTVVLGPATSGDYYSIAGGTIQSNTNKLYLNAATSASTSYKPLSWGTSATTTYWQLEGDTIILNNPRTLGFIACPTSNANYYTLYLQEGNDKPSSSCSTVDLHLPCLC